MVKKDKTIKNLEEELGVNVTEILRGILPVRALKEMSGMKLRVIFDNVRKRSDGIEDISYDVILLKNNTRIGFCSFLYEQDKFIGLRYSCNTGSHLYNTKSSLRQLRG